MEDAIRLFRKSLFHAYYDWAEKNKDVIGEKWYTWFLKKGKKAEGDCDTPIKIMGTALWMFNMISNFGILAGLGPGSVNLQHLDERLDEKSLQNRYVSSAEEILAKSMGRAALTLFFGVTRCINTTKAEY